MRISRVMPDFYDYWRGYEAENGVVYLAMTTCNLQCWLNSWYALLATKPPAHIEFMLRHFIEETTAMMKSAGLSLQSINTGH